MSSKIKLIFLMLSSGIFFVLPPFLLGGVYSHTGTNLIIMFVCAFATFLYSVYLLVTKKSFAVSSVIFPLAAIIVFALLQLIPLPLPLLKILSPQGYFFHTLEGSGAHPLTMSIPDTVYSIFRVLTLIFLSSILARNIFLGNKKWKQNTIDTVILISTVAIILSVALRFLQSDAWLYGKLRHGGFFMESILINTNNAAGFFGISGLLALTSIYTSDFQRKKIFYAALFFFHSAAVAATLSRAGISAYVAALVLFFFINRRSIKKSSGYKFYLPVGALVLALVFIYQTGLKLLEREFDFEREGFFNKVSDIARAKDYFFDFLFTGSGLGSFSKVFSYYQSNLWIYARELENEPIQFILETGIVFAIFIFAFFIWLVIFGHRETKRKNGLMAVLFFVVMHNTFDFNLHNFATLFPVILVLVLLVKPMELRGNTRIVSLVALAVFALTTMIFTSTGIGQKLMGYSPEQPVPYEEAVYMQPANFRIPLNVGVDKLNSRDQEQVFSAVTELSAALAKAPKYYYNYYINGIYLLRIGAYEQALVLFKQALDVSDKKFVPVLDTIYDRLTHFGLQERITEIISLNDKNKVDLERFIFKISDKNAAALDFAQKNQDVFFISVIRDMLKDKRYDEALDMISRIQSERKDLTDLERGQLMLYHGKILEKDKLYKEAFDLYMRGADLTGRFGDYLTAAYCSLKLGKESQDLVESTLKNMTLRTSGNLGNYYRWLSTREFAIKNTAAGFKYLERAAEVSRNPYWLLEVANMYAKRGMHYFAAQNFLKITRDYPKFRPEEMRKRYEEEKQKMEKDEEKNLKELMFREKK